MTPIAVRSDSDLGGVDAPEDAAAFANEYGAEGTSRDDHAAPGISLDGDGDDDGDGDGDSGQDGIVSGVFPAG